MADDDEKKNGLGIDWLRTLGGALAAVTTAVLLSTLGAAGTIIGAALGSVAATVGTAFYTEALARSRERVASAQRLTSRKVGVAQAEVRRAQRRGEDADARHAHLGSADERLGEARRELETDPEPEPVTDRLALLPWKRILVTAAAVFLAALLAITAFELLSGRSVASHTGGTDRDRGTTIGSVTRDDPGTGQQESPRPEPTDEVTPTSEPTSSAPSSGEPVTTPTPTSTPSDVPPPAEPLPTEPAPPTEPPTSAGTPPAG